jgi:hypothetical protein
MDRVRVMQVVMENIAKHIVHQTKGLFAREEVLYIMCSKSCEGDVFFFQESAQTRRADVYARNFLARP